MKSTRFLWSTTVVTTILLLIIARTPTVFSAGDDVAIANVTPSTSIAYVGANITIIVVASNVGTSTVTFNVFTKANQTVIDRSSIIVAAGHNKTLSVKWLTTSYDPGSYVVSANATLSSDVNLSNNVFTDGSVRLLPSIVGATPVPIDRLALVMPFLPFIAFALVAVTAMAVYMHRRQRLA